MARNLKPPLLESWAIGVVVMLFALVVLGMAAEGRTLVQWPLSLWFSLGMLLLAALGRYSVGGEGTSPALRRGRRALIVVLSVSWIIVIGALGWRYLVDPAERAQQNAPAALPEQTTGHQSQIELGIEPVFWGKQDGNVLSLPTVALS